MAFFDIDQYLERLTRSKKRRRLIKTALFSTLALLLVITAVLVVKLSTLVSEPLSIVLTPTEEHVKARQGEAVSTSFTLGTNNYLFCAASCSYTLEHLGTQSVTQSGKGIILDDNTYELPFTLVAPPKGYGVETYRLHVSCENQERRLCTRPTGRMTTAAIITLAYGPSEAEQALREQVRPALRGYLDRFSTLDAQVRAVAQALNPRFGIGVEPLTALRDDLRATAEELLTLWENEAYTSVRVGIPSTAPLAEQLEETRTAARNFVARQQAFITRLNETLDRQSVSERAALFSAANRSALLAMERENTARLHLLARAVEESPFRRLAERNRTLALYEKNVTLLESRALGLLHEALFTVTRALANQTNTTLPSANTTTLNGSLALLTERCALLNESRTNESLEVCSWPEQPLPVFNASFVNRTYSLERAVYNEPSIESEPLRIPAQERRCCTASSCCCDCAETTVLFLHGHSFSERNSPEYSVSAFRTLQERLHAEGLVDAGFITPYSAYVAPEGDWEHLDLTIAGTYYYDAYLRGESYALSLAKSESIDTYAIRLRDLVRGLRGRTHHNLTIVAHSMGGLVARRYLQLFGAHDVAQLITIATPHAGLPRRVAQLCPVFGADKECMEMRADSLFIAKLNDPAHQPLLPITTIAGTGCATGEADGDGVVTVESALLPNTTQYRIAGSCPTAGAFHNALLETQELFSLINKSIQQT